MKLRDFIPPEKIPKKQKENPYVFESNFSRYKREGFNQCKALYDELLEQKVEVDEGKYEYYALANYAGAFVDLKPEHLLYHSIRTDLKNCLKRLKPSPHL